MAESEYDRLTGRSIEAKRRLDRAEEYFKYPSRDGAQSHLLWQMRRNRALNEYLEIEAERKRAAPPPPPDDPDAS